MTRAQQKVIRDSKKQLKAIVKRIDKVALELEPDDNDNPFDEKAADKADDLFYAVSQIRILIKEVL